MKLLELFEGGWASTQTQNTKITPALVNVVVDQYKQFIDQFNNFLKQKNMPPVRAGRPVGSTFYYKQDLASDPNKEYGDIDVHFIIPRLDGMTNSKNESTYAELVKEFLSGNSSMSTDNGTNVIFKIKDQYVQVDLISIFYENTTWAGALTPERNVKGIISTSVYSTMAELLNLSVSTHGVQIKIKDGMPVSFRQSSGVTLDTVSKSPDTWALDILNYFYKKIYRNQGEPRISDLLSQHSGVDPENIKTSDIVNAVKGLAQSLELNGMFGKMNMKDIKNYSDFIKKFDNLYTQKIENKINSTKFDKAQTPLAIEKSKKDKEKLKLGLEMVKKMINN